MAKRRKEKDESEDKPFKLPKFDKEKFLKRERRNIKTTILSFILGLIIAIISFGFWVLLSGNSMRWPLVIIFGILTGSWLKYFFIRLKIDLTDFTKKNWLSSYMIYFFTWLVILMILVNPPFYDEEEPYLKLVVLPEMQEPGGDVIFVAKITDNEGIKKSSIQLDITDPDGNTTSISPSEYEYDDIIAKFLFENNQNLIGEFTYTLSVEDIKGKTAKKTGSFSYSEDIIEITSSRFENITSGDDITIEVDEKISPENFRVYYRLNDGEEINVDRKYVDIKSEYESSPEYEGWEENSKYNMTVFAEVSYYFTNINNKYSNIVEDNTSYEFSTGTASKIGSETPPMPWNWTKNSNDQAPVLLNYDNAKSNKSPLLPHPRSLKTPGFEIIIFLISLGAVVLIFKYRKKDKRN